MKSGSIRIETIAILTGWGLTILGLVWSTASDRTAALGQIAQIEAQTKDHEGRIRNVEKTVIEAANNVRWIRDQMEKEPRLRP